MGLLNELLEYHNKRIKKLEAGAIPYMEECIANREPDNPANKSDRGMIETHKKTILYMEKLNYEIETLKEKAVLYDQNAHKIAIADKIIKAPSKFSKEEFADYVDVVVHRHLHYLQKEDA